MKNIIEYLNNDIIEITEAQVEQNAIGAVKALKDGMDNAIKIYIENHKPTDTVNDYIRAVSKTLEQCLKISLSKVFTVDKIKDLVQVFIEGAKKEVKKKGFSENTPFNEFWANK